MMQEIFKDIPGYYGLYQVSNLGRVKSLSREVKLRTSEKRILKEKILKPGKDTNGYLFVVLYINNKSKTRKIHQLVAESFLNHKPNGCTLVINHKNFIRNDNRLNNLEIVTMRENGNLKHKTSTSKYVGVCWDKQRNKWKAYIKLNGKLKNLGRFKNEIDAHNAYQNELKQII